jgi:NAD(P)-dependent dehydrogenase (short-subunit alcohol dehydrogenase family)
MRVVLASRREELLRATAQAVQAAGGEAFVFPADLSDREQVAALAAAAEAQFGRVDLLLANAGAGYSARMEQITDEQIERTVATNLLGTIRLVRGVLPGMIARRSGHVITVSSVAAGIVFPRGAVYAATKAGIHLFSEGLRREVRGYGIQVTDVMPGIIDTPMTAYMKKGPKEPVETAVRAIVDVMRHPRRCVIVPRWYRLILAINRHFPALADAAIARMRPQSPD